MAQSYILTQARLRLSPDIEDSEPDNEVLICGGYSIGYFLSACLLVGFDREVYNTGLKWKHPFPHFYCNVEDARMGGRVCELTVSLMQLAPMFFFTGICQLWYPNLVYVLLLGIFMLTLPNGHSPACLLLRSHREYYRKTVISQSYQTLS